DGPPRGGPEQPGEHPDGGGLSCSVRSQEPEHLASADVEVEPLHRGARTEVLREGADLDAAQSMVTSTNFTLRSRSTCSMRWSAPNACRRRPEPGWSYSYQLTL